LTTRERSTDVAVLERLVSPAGRDAVDIGCGQGALVRRLAALGARMTGIEISSRQLAAAVAADDDPGARYLVGTAQRLPLDDASVDLAIFMRSLHHVPVDSLADALREAARVLREGGLVYVAEPLAEGEYFELVSLVEDELEVRRAAQRALANAGAAGLSRETTLDYEVEVELSDLAALRARTVAVDPARARVFEARETEIADAFARLGEPTGRGPGRRFIVPMRADVLRLAVR
jgi:SAM-dependent methyltransferase